MDSAEKQHMAFMETNFGAGWTSRIEHILPTTTSSVPIEQFLQTMPHHLIYHSQPKIILINNANGHKKIQDRSNEKYKTILCNSFATSGNCRYGLSCLFAHGPRELRPIPKMYHQHNGNGNNNNNAYYNNRHFSTSGPSSLLAHRQRELQRGIAVPRLYQQYNGNNNNNNDIGHEGNRKRPSASDDGADQQVMQPTFKPKKEPSI